MPFQPIRNKWLRGTMCAAENILDSVGCKLSEQQSESIFHLNSDDFRPLPQKPRTRYESEQVPQSEQEIVEIELASQFYSWLGSSLEDDSKSSNTAEATLSSQFAHQEAYCTAIINKTDEILSTLQQLKEKYNSVSEKTNNLHETCESLLRKQTDLSEKANQIEEKLQFFNSLSFIENKLSNRNLILSPDRMDSVLKTIDLSLSFLESHRSFKDSEAFLVRFNNCLNTALLMVKEGIKNSIRQVVLEIVELGDAISPENSFILLYGRFRSQASRVRALMQLMESRASNSVRYLEVISECQTYYLAKREALVVPVARASIADLTAKYAKDHCELCRTTVSFMLHMVEDESLLFWRFFESSTAATSDSQQAPPSNPPALESMLTNLCNCAYDALRPFLIHVNHIEILTELCDLLVHEFIEDKAVANPNVDLEVFKTMCRSLLADVQQRLIYRADVYIKSQIKDYEPSVGDIAYPEKLEMIEQIASTLQQKQQQQQGQEGAEVPRKISSSSTDFHGMWYPTVRRALVCISGLSRCLDVGSFQGLAQNCLSACLESLVVAQRRIEARRSPADGQLFLIKHLLILREQVTPFNVDFRIRETSLDFSNIKNAAYDALPRFGSKLFDFNRANHLLRLLLVEGPKVVETDVDSRRQLDRYLKVTCEAFIAASIASLTAPIAALVDKARQLNTSSSPPKQALGPPNQLKEAISTAVRLLSIGNQSAQEPTSQSGGGGGCSSLAEVRRRLGLYLGNANTVAILLRPVENGVVQVWRKLAASIEALYSQEERMIIACPSDSQIRLLFHA